MAGLGRDQVGSVAIRNASETERAMPEIPPAARTAACQLCCCGVRRPDGVLTSIERKTASLVPTISGVTTTVRQPMRSAEPLVKPKVTRRPVRGSGREPT